MSSARKTIWHLRPRQFVAGHSDAKTTRKSYASPSVEMLRETMKSGMEAEPNFCEEEKPLWKSDQELARLCGVR